MSTQFTIIHSHPALSLPSYVHSCLCIHITAPPRPQVEQLRWEGGIREEEDGMALSASSETREMWQASSHSSLLHHTRGRSHLIDAFHHITGTQEHLTFNDMDISSNMAASSHSNCIIQEKGDAHSIIVYLRYI